MNAYSLSGLGCNCEKLESMGLGAVTDFDIITIGGKQYSANSILDSQLNANRDVKLFRGADFTTPYATIKAGQPIGKVYSYIKANSTTGQRAGGPLLEFLDTSQRSYYVKDDKAIDQSFLKAQGVETVQEELKKEQEEKERAADPVGHYIKKYGLWALLIVGGIYAVTQFGKEAIKAKLT